ncbi:MAG: hypothetical protein RR365_10460 [Bacteroides sp.]
MINIESEIFSLVRNSIINVYPSSFVVGEYVKSPSSFPCVSLVETDNVPLTRTQTTDSVENHVSVMYEVNVYSNKAVGKKTECKNIIEVIDSTMAVLGFSRIMLTPIPNMDEATIYRITGRYRAVISKNKTIFRR